jgi:hypothetical protein
MARVVLHIGTHKTATTTIQDLFRHNAAILARHGLIYPVLDPRHSGHHGLVMDWNPLPKVYELAEGSTTALRRIAAEHAAGQDTVFLSSEEFSRGAAGARVDFRAVRRALAAFDRIQVLCVLREQWRFLQSVYVELSKYRPPPRPVHLVAEALATGMAEGLWLDYDALYDHLLTAFAPDEITFLDFDDAARGAGGIPGAVLRELGLPVGPEALETVGDGHANVSRPPLAVWGACLVAEPSPPSDWLVSAMSGALEAGTGQSANAACLWTRSELAALQDFAARKNRRLCERRADCQPGFTISSSSPAPGAVHREDLTSDFWLRGARWVFAACGPPAQAAPA